MPDPFRFQKCPVLDDGAKAAINITQFTDYTNGVIKTSKLFTGNDNSIFDNTVGKFKAGQLEGYVSFLMGTTANAANSYLKPRPTTNFAEGVSDNIVSNVSTMPEQDVAILNELNKEYCYYYVRYDKALTEFFAAISGGADSTTKLGIAKGFNFRLNALMEIIEYLAKQRIVNLNAATEFINETNRSLSDTHNEMMNQSDFLQKQDAIIRTRKEMIRYTTEKNNHITNQISLWAALNILAIGSIFTVYHSMK
jgi:hypothetical protein